MFPSSYRIWRNPKGDINITPPFRDGLALLSDYFYAEFYLSGNKLFDNVNHQRVSGQESELVATGAQKPISGTQADMSHAAISRVGI